MKKPVKQPNQGYEQKPLTIMAPHKVRLSQNGKVPTLMVFINEQTVLFLNKNFIDAIFNSKSKERKGA